MGREDHENFELAHLIAGEYGEKCAYLVEDKNGLLEINLEGEWDEFSIRFVEKEFSKLIETFGGSGNLEGFCKALEKAIKHFIK